MIFLIFFAGVLFQPCSLSTLTYQLTIPISTGYPHANLYGKIDQPLDEYTLCHWTRNYEDKDFGTVFDYNANNVDDVLSTIQGDNGTFLVYQNGEKAISFDSNVDTLSWLHSCVTSSTTRGNINLYINGVKVHSANTKKPGQPIPANEVIVLGQSMKANSDKFLDDHKFSGQIADLYLWDRILTPKQISAVYKCNFSEDANVINWYMDSWTLFDGARVSSVNLPCGEE